MYPKGEICFQYVYCAAAQGIDSTCRIQQNKNPSDQKTVIWYNTLRNLKPKTLLSMISDHWNILTRNCVQQTPFSWKNIANIYTHFENTVHTLILKELTVLSSYKHWAYSIYYYWLTASIIESYQCHRRLLQRPQEHNGYYNPSNFTKWVSS